jgi:transcriptional regulator GlxA family with amidase domain
MPITPRFQPSVKRVEIVAFDRVQLLDVTGPLQVFASVNDLCVRGGEPARYDCVVVAQRASVTSSAGLALATRKLLSATQPVDTLIVAGGFGVDAACASIALLDWLAMRAAGARRVASVCSGAFLLASAGLLDGRRVATHWSRCGELASRFPRVRVEPDPIFVRDGNVWTSAGIMAGIDLALALVEQDHGREIALAVARQLVVFLKRPGGQAQFSQALALQYRGAGFERLHAWMADHLTGDLSVGALASVAGMSERTFARRYRGATGTTPARAVERLRVEAARSMLEEGRSVKRAAARSGFGSEETMRRSFLRLLRTTPSDYRDRFYG